MLIIFYKLAMIYGFIECYFDEGQKSSLFIAWGGKSCDCEWLFIVAKNATMV